MINQHKKDVEKYIVDILNGHIASCVHVQNAVKRHMDDYQKWASDEDYPFYFDENAATKVINFVELLKHYKGKWAGTYLKLEPWQKFILWVLFGWKKKYNDCRRFNKAYLEVARKNAKTTTAAAIGDYMLAADGEAGAEIYSVATKRDQAKISWEAAKAMIQSQPTLRRGIKVFHKALVNGTSTFVPLSSDDKSEDGHSPHFAIIDEYHQHSSDGMLNSIETGMGARTQPLIFIITTAGFDKSSACYVEHERAVRVLEGASQDENYFAIIYTLDEGDDWTDKSKWVKANPNLGVSVFEDYLERMVNLALDSPTKTNSVLTKNFNVWTQAQTRWINYAKWEDNLDNFDEEILRGRDAYGGLDLSTTTDITAFVLSFPPTKEGERHKKLYKFFIPEEGILDRERRDKVPYTHWVDEGYVIATPGSVVDYDYVESVILEAASKYNIKEVAFDPYNSSEIVSRLMKEGIEMVEFRQGFISMSPACKAYERLILQSQFATNNNPVMNWMIGCTEVATDPAGNIKPKKPNRDREGKRIDGVVADIMATHRSILREGKKRSVYESRGVRSINL